MTDGFSAPIAVIVDSVWKEIFTSHVLYQPGDPDTPSFIKKRDGGVLQLCRVCGLGEMRLVEPCVSAERPKQAGDVADDVASDGR
ncbi:MAG: hypothetical protein Q7T86_07255 [Hyphomicrobiaceae bacterium]|nr:hypothetical protein [Hyphomicrobiaceae bacterium]